MKNPFRLMTIFMAIIGGCAASLVIYILTIYPNLNRDVKDKNVEISSSYTNTAQENITIDDKQTEDSSSSEYSEIAAPSSETESNTEPIKSGTYNIDDIEFWFSDSVRNDITGNWRIASIASSKNITDYVIDYYNTLFSSNEEIHAIVNFSLNTSSSISVLYDGMLDVVIHEYIDGEEHDANVLFGGMLLKEYWINTKSGEIDEIPIPIHPDLDTLASENEQILSTELPETESIDNSLSSPAISTEENSTDINVPANTTAENSNQTADNSISAENESNYNMPESQVLTPVGDMVWLSATGEKYHRINNCGRMNPDKARQVSLEYAVENGYEKCTKCY